MPHMRVTTDEILHPEAWLRRVLTEPAEFERLLYQSAGQATAAYRLALAQCRATGQPDRAPSLAELKLAARMIAARTNSTADVPLESARAVERPASSRPRTRTPLPARAFGIPTPPSRRRAS